MIFAKQPTSIAFFVLRFCIEQKAKGIYPETGVFTACVKACESPVNCPFQVPLLAEIQLI